MYPFYEKILAAGVKTVCIHKGLMPSDYEKSRPGIWKYATVDDVPKAAGDWPDLNFVIYHSAMRPALNPALEAKEFEETGYIRWVSDLAAIPKKFDVNNVFAEIGTVFGSTVITNPRLAAGMLGTIIKGMGVNHLIWGTDSVWWGSPQWQIEALRRLEIPDDLLEKHKFAPLGRADGAVKNKIFWDNGARLYGLPKRVEYRQSIQPDLIDEMKEQFKISNVTRSNAAYGYVMPSRKPPVSATDQCDQAYLA